MKTIDRQVIGLMGNYEVSTEDIFSKFFVPKKETQPDGTVKTISIPIRRSRRNILLVHATTKDALQFSAYSSRGTARFKDSRDKTSQVLIGPILGEMVRLLEIDITKAKHLLIKEQEMISVADLDKKLALTDAEMEIAKLVEAAIDDVITNASANDTPDSKTKTFTVKVSDLETIPGFNAKIRSDVVARYTDNKWKVEITPATIILNRPGKSRGCPKGGWAKQKAERAAAVAADSAGSMDSTVVQTVVGDLPPHVVVVEGAVENAEVTETAGNPT